MKPASIRRLYRNLSGIERFRLTVQADVRGDAAERDHLISNCPRVVVSLRDPEFGGAVRGSMDLVEALLRSSAPFLAWLDLLDSLQLHVQDRSVDGEGLPPVAAQFVKAAADQAARVLRALQEAFARVCHKGPALEPAVLLAAFAPELAGRLRGHQPRVDGAARDPELELACYEELLRAWGARPEAKEGR